ncbi:MAG: UTP--glucose-1-phosphate uridylyltransferase [Deferrisomatales bacterium]|nr:UTP--glucose-1-phosphate uridylyltransferase [Deferrisomatales bacterium]
MDTESVLEQSRRRLEGDGAPPKVWSEFARMYRAYRQGVTGQVVWGEIETVGPEELVSAETFDSPGSKERGEELLEGLVWVVLNGGLGTSMKMDRAKSLVPVKGELTFLDLIARYALRVRRGGRRAFPLLFMNSYATEEDTLSLLGAYPLAQSDGTGAAFPLGFLQNRFPRIREADGLPFGQPGDRESWAPPGHGNLYLALESSGLLDRLLEGGIRWAFVSNADNLGASPHPGILAHLFRGGHDFAIEVTERTEADVKGGALVKRAGRLELLELAQVPEAHAAEFQDPRRFPVFNTNNVWVNLEALRRLLGRGALDLPTIVNRKSVAGTGVVQLESAMGAAVGCFQRATGLLVPRDRFAPVKTTDDLLVRRSDVYREGQSAPLEVNPARDPALGPPVVRLDPECYGSVAELEARVPFPLGLLEARLLEVHGDVHFGEDVRVCGAVTLTGPLRIGDGVVLRG